MSMLRHGLGPRRSGRLSALVVRFGSLLTVMALISTACSLDSGPSVGAAPDSADPTGQTGDAGSGGAESSTPVDGPVESVGGEFGVRIGDGRAVLAETGGPVTVIVTTVAVHALIDDELVELVADFGRGQATSVEVSADGSRVVLGWPDGAELWSLAGDVGIVESFEPVQDAGFLADDQFIVSTETRLEIRSAADGSLIAQHEAAEDKRFGPVAVDPAGGWWAAPMMAQAAESGSAEGASGSIEILSSIAGSEPVGRVLDGGEGLTVFQAEADPSSPRAFFGLSVDGERYGGGTVLVSNLETGSVSSTHPLDPATLWTVAADGGAVIIDREQIRLIEPDGVAHPPQPMPPGYPPMAIHGVSDGGYAVVLQDGSRLTFDEDGTVESALLDTPRFALTSQASTDLTTVTVVDHIGEITVLGPDGSLAFAIDDFIAGTVNDIAISANADIALATSTGAIQLVDANDPGGEAKAEFAHAEGNVDTVAFSPDGSRLVAGVAERRSDVIFDDTLAVWDVAAQQLVIKVGGEREEVPDCSSFSNVLLMASDGSFVVGVSHDFTVFILDGATYERRLTFPSHAGPVLDIALSPDDRRLVTTSQDSTMRVWDTASGELEAEYPTALGGYRSIDVLPDGDHLLAADFAGILHVLDLLTGEATSAFESMVSGASDVEISPDGRLVAAGDGPVLRLWSVDTGRVVGELNGHAGSVATMAFSADGTQVISGSADGTAAVWDLTI